MKARRFVLLVGAAEVAAVVGYLVAVRPRIIRWGAGDGEVVGPLPGDEIVADPMTQSTRAIDVAAPPDDVWPWLVQIGQDRGGLYSYDWLENLLGLRFHSADRPHPEWELEVGDQVLLTPADRGAMGPTVVLKDPPRALVLAGIPTEDEHDDGGPRVSWAFVVRPVDDAPGGAGRSRLLVRWRSSFPPGIASALTNRWLLEPVHFVMERKMLLGIADRAERIVHQPVWPLTAEQLEEVPGFTMSPASGPGGPTSTPAPPTPPAGAGGP